MEKLRVGLLYGGWSYEAYLCAHPSVGKSLKQLGHEVIPIQTADTRLASKLIDAKLDIAFLASHGFYHEDGRLQSVCEWIGLQYTGPNHFASSICMNKIQFRPIADQYSDQPLPYLVVRENTHELSFETVKSRLKTNEVILKPALSGASVGIKAVRSEADFDRFLTETVTKFGETVVEPLLTGFRELSVTVHDFGETPQVLEVCELLTGGELFDFDMKNGYNPIKKELPADLPAALTERVKSIAASIYEDLGLESIIRVDVLLDRQENIHVLEVNTLPGLMPQSVAPAAAARQGMAYNELIQNIVTAGLRKKRFEVSKQTENQPRLSEKVEH
jgi:D-alanine-D-alanine ligase